jgi:Terminase large subunit, T4likevirus-type, N-terminal
MSASAVDFTEDELVMLPAQQEMFFCRDMFAAARGGNGSGKTISWCYWTWLQRMEQYPNSTFQVVAATFQQLRDGFFKTFVSMLREKGLEEEVDFMYRPNPRPSLRLLYNGARIHAWSADTVNRMRGANVQTLIVEEPQTWDKNAEEAWISLVSRLRHNQETKKQYPDLEPQCRVSFNPTGVGPGHWIYEMIETRWKKDGYKCWRLSTRDNVILLEDDPHYVRRMELSMSPDRYRIEIDGEYATFGGEIYRCFRPDIHGKWVEGLPPIALDTTKPILWALDFNIGWMSSVVSQMHTQAQIVVGHTEPEQRNIPPKPIIRNAVKGWQRNICVVLGEFFLRDSTVRDACNAFLASPYGTHAKLLSNQGYIGLRLYGDSTGGNRNQQTAISNWEIVITEMLKAGIRLDVRVPNNPPEIDRVNAMNDQFETGEGYGLLVDLDACQNLVRDWQSVKRKVGTNQIDKSDKSESGLRLTHLADSVGYQIFVERRLAKREPVKFMDFINR